MKKQDYQFFVSQKVTMWIKEKHIIEAESKEQAIKIMLENNSIIKRPVVAFKQKLLVGFDETAYANTFNKK